MGLGISQEGIYDVLSIPLEWDDNETVANHFRMLADEIEKSQINIQRFRLSAPFNGSRYEKTCLEVVGFNKNDQEDD